MELNTSALAADISRLKKMAKEIRGERVYVHELEQRYEEMIDECYEPVEIFQCKYAVSDIIKNVDPVVYRIGFNEWLDDQVSEGHLREEGDEYYEGGGDDVDEE